MTAWTPGRRERLEISEVVRAEVVATTTVRGAFDSRFRYLRTKSTKSLPSLTKLHIYPQPSVATSTMAPFDENTQLNDQPTKIDQDHLPGCPRIQLFDGKKLYGYLERNLFSLDLENVADYLWWMSKQDSKNISPLHRQYVKSRHIIVTEDPKLHLIWIKNRIFIKPLPEYLLSYSFWEHCLLQPNLTSLAASEQQARIRKAALGLLRTYFYLVQYESDFRVAKDPSLTLIPTRVTWEQFCAFSARFDAIRDDEVTRRYSYGEIRLSRLNFYYKLLSRGDPFHRLTPQYGEYFARFYGPILFIFGFLSVILSAMQVEIAVEQLDSTAPWQTFQRVSRVFTVLCLVSVCFLTIIFVLLLVYKVAREWRYALADRIIHRQEIHECRWKENEVRKAEIDVKPAGQQCV